MNKFTKLMLAASMSLSLAACGGGSSQPENNSDKTEVTMWVHQELSWNKAHQALADAYMEQHPDVQITIESFPYDDFESKVQTSLINGEGGADIYEIWGGWGLDFAPTGALLKLDDELAAKIKEESYAPTYGALEVDGDIYGIPCEFNTETGGMIVNYNVAADHGIKELPTTWDELIKNAESVSQLDENGDVLKGFDFVNWDSVPYLFLSMIKQQGGEYLVSENEINVNTPEAKAAFQELADLIGKTTTLEGLTGGADIESYQQCFAGRALYVPRGPWCVAEGVDTWELEYGKDFEYVQLPWWKDKVAYVVENGWSIAGNAKTEHADIVNDFLDFVYQDENLMALNIACSQISSKKAINESEEYISKMEYVKPLLDILDEADFIGHFNTDRLKEAVNDTFVAYGQGEYKNIDDCMADLNKKLNEMFE